MENLDNKYFETVIMALKKAKANQKIEIRPDFKASLRAGIEKQALSMNAVDKVDWADWILRYKYILGGVPVLAVLTLVAVNALNFQVKMPKGEMVPSSSVPVITESTVVQSGLNQTDAYAAKPKIKTFSADLVMPPEEYLQKRLSVSDVQGVVVQTGADTNVNATEYMFLDGANVQLKFGTTQDNGDSAAATAPVQADPAEADPVEQNLQTRELQDSSATSVSAIPVVPAQPVVREEQSGRVEESGTVDQPVSAEQPVEQQTVAPVLSTTVQTLTKSQPLTETTKTVLPEVRTESVDYINPVIEQNQTAPKMTIQYRTLNVDTPQFLAADRIYLTSTERDTVVNVVMKGLSSRNGNLSSDYYVHVIPLENNTYKATLYEFGQVKQVLILAERDGRLSVVTELVY